MGREGVERRRARGSERDGWGQRVSQKFSRPLP